MKRYTLRPLRSPVQFIFYGMLISWAVGIVHWIVVETNVYGPRPLGRFVMDDDFSGVYLLEESAEAARSVYAPDDWKSWQLSLYGHAYGWPIPSLGVVVAEARGEGSPSPREWVYCGLDLSPIWYKSPGVPVDYRVIPLFPLVGQSLLSGMIYGTLLWVGLVAWRQYKRRSEVLPCTHCHYELAGNSSDRCPECGSVRATTEKANSPGTPS